MIKKLKIRGFKRFSEQELRLERLTVLAGINGSGKTSVVHAILLAREAAISLEAIVQLNGPYGLELGTFGDIQNWYASETMEIECTDDDTGDAIFKFSGDPAALYASFSEFHSVRYPFAFGNTGRAFQYLSAERYGPRSVLGSAALPPDVLDVGHRGEFTAQVLYALGSNPVDAARCCPVDKINDENSRVKVETERWMSQIVRPVQIDTEVLPGTMITALRYRSGVEWVRPPNMGFGVTYALPIVVSALTMETGGILVVENPEAHLHPLGQSRMGQFLAAMAAAGIQVVLETHSDHVLNGVRRSIGETKVLAVDDAIVHFFGSDGGGGREGEGRGDGKTPIEPVRTLRFTETGGISDWPTHFFDQYQIDIAALSRVRRSDKR